MSSGNVTRGDILDMFVRQDRVKKIIEKKEKEWLQEEKDKKNGVGGPIKFGSAEKEKEEFLDWMLEMMEEDSDEEDSDEEDSDEEYSECEENGDKSEKVEEEKLPSYEGTFVPKKMTIEEIVKQRIDEYSSTLYHMDETPFVRICIKEGVLNEDQVFF